MKDNDRTFKLYFGDTWRSANKIHLRTNDNYFSVIDFDATMIPDWNDDSPKIVTFDWGHKFNNLDSLDFKTDIYEISIEDINGKLHNIYRNSQYSNLYKK